MPRRSPPPPAPETAPASFQPAESLRLTTPEQIKAINDPLRLEMLELIVEDARTVKQVADMLGKPPTKLYYHMNALEAAGFVKIVETRVKSGIIEKYYRAVALSFQVDRKLLKAKGGSDHEALDNLLAVIFDATADDVRRSAEAGLLPIDASAKKLRDKVVMTRTIFTLREADVPKFTAKLQALLQELEAADVKDGVAYGLTLAFYPRVSKNPGRKTK
jgi:DNA-binding transcriptional ArsR family regulator